MSCFFTKVWRLGLLLSVLLLAITSAARADEVTDWHEHMLSCPAHGGGQSNCQHARCGACFGSGIRFGEWN